MPLEWEEEATATDSRNFWTWHAGHQCGRHVMKKRDSCTLRENSFQHFTRHTSKFTTLKPLIDCPSRAFNIARARAAEYCCVLRCMRGCGMKQLDGEEVAFSNCINLKMLLFTCHPGLFLRHVELHVEPWRRPSCTSFQRTHYGLIEQVLRLSVRAVYRTRCFDILL